MSTTPKGRKKKPKPWGFMGPMFDPAPPELEKLVKDETLKLMKETAEAKPGFIARTLMRLDVGVPVWDVSRTEHLTLRLKLIDKIREEYGLPKREKTP